jgi:hypothetical protein
MTYNPPVTTPQSDDAVTINDRGHTLTWVEPRLRNGVLIRQGQNHLYLSTTEIARLIDAVTESEGHANNTVYSTSTPAKAKMTRWIKPQPSDAKT